MRKAILFGICFMLIFSFSAFCSNLFEAINSGDIERVTSIINENPEILDSKDDNGFTPLYMAIYNNNPSMVKLLTNNGADVNALTPQGFSVFYYALSSRSRDIIDLMIEQVSSYDFKDDLGHTMLHFAAARGFSDIVEKLIDHNLDVNAQNINGVTALDYAVMWQRKDIVELLQNQGAKSGDNKWNKKSGDYLGLNKPGKTPEPFGDNLFVTPFKPHGSIVFSPDGNRLFWCHHALPIQVMWYMKQIDGIWQSPEFAPFTDPSLDYADGHMSFSHDGRNIFYHSQRPIGDGAEPKEDLDIWSVEIDENNFSEPKRLGSIINTNQNEYGPTVSKNGNLYFVAEGYEDCIGASDIYMSEFKDGNYLPPKNLGLNVNSDRHELTPSIAPDESYIIFASTRQNSFRHFFSLLVSFRRDDGSWTEAIRLDNSINNGRCWHPKISPDGKYIFYLAGGQYYWFSSQVITDLKDGQVGRKMKSATGE